MNRDKKQAADEWGAPPEDPDELAVPPMTPRAVLDQLVFYGDGPIRAGFDVTGGWVSYKGRFFVPRAFTAMYDVPGLPQVFLRVLVDDAGGKEIDEIQCLRRPGHPSLSGTTLREIPVATI